jgi:integrase
MSIYPDKKNGIVTGRWRVEVQLGTMRKRGRFDSHEEAKKAESRFMDELARGEADNATARADQLTVRTLSQLLPRAAKMIWSRDKHGVMSVAKVEWIIRECGDIRLDSIPADYVERLVLKLQKGGKAPATINRYLSALRAVLRWGAKPARGYVPVLPEFDWQEEHEGRIRWLTADEERRLIATLQALGYNEVADLCIVAIDTGCRRAELLEAQRDQFDGKWLRLWKTKSHKPRSVPLSDRAQEILQARLPWTVKEHNLRYAWDKAKVALGLSSDDEFVFHCLRHTRATRLVEMGVNLRIIQQFMGHEKIETTLRYAHVSDDMLAKVGVMMDAWNNSVQTVSARTKKVGVIEAGETIPHPGGRETLEMTPSPEALGSPYNGV